MKSLREMETPIEGVYAVEAYRVEDERGYLSRLFCSEIMEKLGWTIPVAQINFTKTICKGTVRGFHFQNPPFAEYKYVKCIRGEVYDVALDLRCGSSTFLQTHSQILSETNNISYLLPPGVAHGFQALTDDAQLLYIHSQSYNPKYDDGVNPLDPRVDVSWPLEITSLSEKDGNRKFITTNYKGLLL